MKKDYKKPSAEKVVFDYVENVVACSWIPQQEQPQAPSGLHQENGKWYYNDQKVNDDPYSSSHMCKSTDHWGCYQF